MTTNKNKGLSATTKKNPRGRLPGGQPNPIDVHVGRRLLLRRTLLGISQECLAHLLGLTFQQIQKYERGQNRIGASRLWDLSKVLKVPVGFFFEDMDKGTAKQSPRMVNEARNISSLWDEEISEIDPMDRQETIMLVKSYYKIPNRKTAKHLLDMIVSMSKTYGK